MIINDLPHGKRCTILLTGGRAPVALELARAFYREGHRVLVAESARHHLCRVSRAVERSFLVPAPNKETEAYLDTLESIVVNEQVNVLLPTCEEIFFIAQGLDRLRRHCDVWASPIDAMRELHDKWRFVLLAERLGLTVPASELIRTEQDWMELANRPDIRGDGPDGGLVLKPVYSRFASRILFLRKEDSSLRRRRLLEQHISDADRKSPWLAQRTVQGREISTFSIAYEGELIVHAAYLGRYRVGQGASVYFESIDHEASHHWVSKLVKAIGYTGQIAFDFIEEQDGSLYALECNPRSTSGIHLFDTDSGIVEAFLRPSELRSTGVAINPKEGKRAMLAAAMPAAGWREIRSIRGLRNWLAAVFSARDVVFSRGDMRPFAEQLRVLYESWRISREHLITLSGATTIDIEWNGDE